MSGWTTDELSRIEAADELEIAVRRSDGSLHGTVPIWVVRVGDDLYVRSWHGPDGRWYRAARAGRKGHITTGGVQRDVALIDADGGVNDAVDDAYREKYGRYASPPNSTTAFRRSTSAAPGRA